MRTRPVINLAGAHRGCEAGKLYELFKVGEACLGRGVTTLTVNFGSFAYDTQIGVSCITMAVALWCFSLAVECPLPWHGELRAKRTQTSAAALTRGKGFAALS